MTGIAETPALVHGFTVSPDPSRSELTIALYQALSDPESVQLLDLNDKVVRTPSSRPASTPANSASPGSTAAWHQVRV